MVAVRGLALVGVGLALERAQAQVVIVLGHLAAVGAMTLNSSGAAAEPLLVRCWLPALRCATIES